MIGLTWHPVNFYECSSETETFAQVFACCNNTNISFCCSGNKDKKDERPKSAGNMPARNADEKKGSSEPVDWLGLSRLASPSEKETAKSKEEEKPPLGSPKKETRRTSFTNEDDFLGSSGGTSRRPRSRDAAKSEADDDWLGLGTSSTTAGRGRQSRSETPDKLASASKQDDDWLGLGSSSTPAGRGRQSRSESPDKLASASKQDDDWLGLGKDNDDSDDWLSTTLKAKKERKTAGEDRLGAKDNKTQSGSTSDLGNNFPARFVHSLYKQCLFEFQMETPPGCLESSKMSQKDNNFVLLSDSKSLPVKSQADERGLDLFSSSTRRESA